MLEALVLGLVQGITEFFPVSSTAHLILVPKLFASHNPEMESLGFDVALHAGTLLALVVFFWRDWIKIITGDKRLFVLIMIATVPGAVLGVLLENLVETRFRTPLIIAGGMAVFGLVMLASEKFKSRKSVRDVGLKDALFIGFAQALALVPGVSRSGATITAGLFAGMERKEAARFSFLLSMPIVAGACLFEGRKMLHAGGAGGLQINLFIAGVAASFISGLFAIKYLLKFLQNHSINTFAYYRFGLAALIIGLTVWSVR